MHSFGVSVLVLLRRWPFDGCGFFSFSFCLPQRRHELGVLGTVCADLAELDCCQCVDEKKKYALERSGCLLGWLLRC